MDVRRSHSKEEMSQHQSQEYVSIGYRCCIHWMPTQWTLVLHSQSTEHAQVMEGVLAWARPSRIGLTDFERFQADAAL